MSLCTLKNLLSYVSFSHLRHNLAFNRMTRMLSDLSKMNCYNRSHLTQQEIDNIMLTSAKEHIESFAFFGVLEHQQETQFLFERTFGINFSTNFVQRKRTHVKRLLITDEMKKLAVEKNLLDISLYQFALDLFWQRVRLMEKLSGFTVNDYFDYIRQVDPEEQRSKSFYINNRKKKDTDPER